MTDKLHPRLTEMTLTELLAIDEKLLELAEIGVNAILDARPSCMKDPTVPATALTLGLGLYLLVVCGEAGAETAADEVAKQLKAIVRCERNRRLARCVRLDADASGAVPN